MRNKSNKGFTLVELIIAMSIFTVVIGLGYGMINKIDTATRNQSEVTSNQLNVNLINKYVTKDLEQCKTFEGPENENVGSNYEFIINKDDEQIKYMVLITSKGNKEYYTLTRKTKDSEIDLAVNQPKISKTPFFIKEKEDKDNLFTVQVDNVKETSGQYMFEVSSRLVASSDVLPDIPVPPTTVNPDEEFDGYNKASFWIDDSSDDKVNIGISNEGKKKHENFNKNKDVVSGFENSYGMNMFLDFGNSGNKKNKMVLSNGNDKIEQLFQTGNYTQEKYIKIVIEVGPNTKCNVKEVKTNLTTSILTPSISNNSILEQGVYTYLLNNNKTTLEIIGSIIKEGTNSFVNIYYGKSK